MKIPRPPSYLVLPDLVIVCGCGGTEEQTGTALTNASEGPANVDIVASMEAPYSSAILAHDGLS